MPRALPASHFAGGRRMAAKAPRGAMEILGRALSGSKSAEPPLRAGLRKTGTKKDFGYTS